MYTCLDASITSVRLYRSGATVTRTLSLSHPLPEQLRVTGLPLSLSPSTVRARVVQASGGTVTVAGLRLGVYVRPRNEAPEAPEAQQLRKTQQEIRKLRSRIDQINIEIAALSSIPTPARPRGEDGRPPPPSPMAARLALERFTDQSISARLEERAELSEALTDQERIAAEQQDQLRRATRAHLIRPDEVTHALTAQLHTTGTPQDVVVAVDYFVPGARWAPTYQMMVDRKNGTATLQMRALIAQRTGEDWENVTLEASTADPATNQPIPSLAAMRIGKSQPPPPSRGYRAPPSGGADLFSDFDRDRKKAVAAQQRSPILEDFSVTPRDLNLTLPAHRSSIHDDELDDYEVEEEVDEISTEAPEAASPEGLSSFFAMGSGAAPPPPAPPAPGPPVARTSAAPQRARKRRRASGAKMAASPKPVAKPAPTGPPPVPPFSELYLPPPESAQRGQLTRITPKKRIQDALQAAQAEASFDIQAHIASARDMALRAALNVPQAARGRFAHMYPAENPLDVPGDGGIHTVPVCTWSAPCEMSYVVVPRIEQKVYRQAELINPANAPLLPGPVEVFIDGQYAVTTTLPLVGEGGRLSLGLGVEQAIRCARNCRFEEQRSGAKIVAMTELLHDIEIELVNTLGRPARCEVRERIPQPDTDAEVVVEESAILPGWEPYTQLERGKKIDGGRRWNVTLDAHQKTLLRARYIVKIYSNNELVGGNRREA